MIAERRAAYDELVDIYRLETVKGFGPQKFKELHEAGLAVSDALARPSELHRFGKRGDDFIKQIKSSAPSAIREAEVRARKQIDVAASVDGHILTYGDPRYPRLLYASNQPLPALYVRGDVSALGVDEAVACVGSRNIRAPFDELHDAFARRAVKLGFAVVSGFATGADIIGHLAATASKGKTVCVMPSGLDRPFPPEHRDIWRRFLDMPGAVFVSEFGFGVGANALNLRKRNKTIAALSLGVLVSQSADDGGAMNAYRFAMEQKKPVATFEHDGTPDTSGNDLIAGSAERVRATVLPRTGGSEWTEWLRTL